MKLLTRLLKLLLITLFTGVFVGVAAVAAVYLYLAPGLPSIETLRDVKLQVPMRVYSADGEFIAEFGEQRRTPLRYDQLPERMIQAILAAEDDRFFDHPGVDWQGLTRAAVNLMQTGERTQGGSTITMQLARNFFLTRDRTYTRKLNEILLAFEIERSLDKEEILTLYLNKIFLGNRAYGVGAAAEVYYGRPLAELSTAQIAMIAGLPKAPSTANPIAAPRRATIRRNWILGRMYQLGYIDEAEYEAALGEIDNARYHTQPIELAAPWVAEMVRQEVVERFGEERAYTEGFRVHTTLHAEQQRAATAALRTGLLDYDRRRGYLGPEQRIPAPANPDDFTAWAELIAPVRMVGGLQPAVVVRVGERQADVVIRHHDTVTTLDWAAMEWARPRLPNNRLGAPPQRAADILAVGDLIRVQPTGEAGWRLAQIPEASGALVALDPENGAITALVGGFDFTESPFNRAVQAQRQPGSSFKPFIFSAALEQGYTAASIVNDAPIVYDDPSLGNAWRPGNYTGRFYGPTRLREAMAQSRNLATIRLMRDIGVPTTVDWLRRFDFSREAIPPNLSLALGTGVITPLELTRGYAVFANGGLLIDPHVISRIEDAYGERLYQHEPVIACPPCLADRLGIESRLLPQAPRAISPQNAYQITAILEEVIRSGTGRSARRLGRNDLAGKTGTSNNFHDAWFSGYNGDLVATAWIGHDQPRSLGQGEAGGRAALPIWIDFMQTALEGRPENRPTMPPGLVSVRIDARTGLLAGPGSAQTLFEVFPEERVPRQTAPAWEGDGPSVTEQLF